MKNSFVTLAIIVLSTPFIIIMIIELLRLPPKTSPVEVKPIVTIPEVVVKPSETPLESLETPQKEVPKYPSTNFMNGYWDGMRGRWLGAIKWTLSEDYRQGHMLGSYDRRKNINRYSKEE